MNYNKLAMWLSAGALAFASQGAVQANTIQTTVASEFRDISAIAETVYHTDLNEIPGRAALDWQYSECKTCDKASSRISFDSFLLPGQGTNDYSGFGSPFALGKLRFQNGSGLGKPGIDSAQLHLNVLLCEAMLEPVDLVFRMSLTAVPGIDTKRNKEVPGDQLTLSTAVDSYVFNTTRGKYRFDLLGWSPDGGVTFTNTLTVADHAFAGLKLYGMVRTLNGGPVVCNVTAVPVPAAAWLFGSGLLALTGLARRR
ncbi:MAG: choice-of-anchor K domain-containing protein [Gammaproteobacteria bacterium]|nr:choice-of-anchor K domain-containing protein [Gammaproteobacteria bacterium]